MCALLEPPEVSARPWLSVSPLAYSNVADVIEEKVGRKGKHHPRQAPKKVSEASKEQDTVCALLGPPEVSAKPWSSAPPTAYTRNMHEEKTQRKTQRDHHRGQKKVSGRKEIEDEGKQTEGQPDPHCGQNEDRGKEAKERQKTTKKGKNSFWSCRSVEKT